MARGERWTGEGRERRAGGGEAGAGEGRERGR